MKLVIVESPTKSKTIKKFLTDGWEVVATYGHIRDLPRTSFGIDPQKNFQPKYIVLPKARKTIKFLEEKIKNSSLVFIATDPDREGEAIAWHLVQLFNLNGKKPYQRIVFHEITKEAVNQAFKNPRKIDINLVNAQQARRVLDRIVGYKLSPFLWKKVARGLSAGRVQSVALKLIVDREREIEKFIPQEYWKIRAQFEKDKKIFEAVLVKKDGKTLPLLAIKSKEEALQIINDLKNAQYLVSDVQKKETKKHPLPPFITSSLQQEAFKKFRWSAKFTMGVAQKLYEMGFCTYHRTDSFNLSEEALVSVKNFIEKKFGPQYFSSFRKYKTKSKVAQEAHEAIRPTNIENLPKSFGGKGLSEQNLEKLYELIWRRFVSCQMKEAVFDITLVDISAKNYIFRAEGQILKFDGFLKVWPADFSQKELPLLEKNQILKLLKLIPSQHFTKPPSRYNEATLIKELEKNGIGRPSTYAPIIFTIQQRNYVKKNEKKFFYPTQIGILVNDLLAQHFSEIVDIGFSAKMEEGLDEIALQKKEWTQLIKDFYYPFIENLEKKEKEIKDKDQSFEQNSKKKCPLCHKNLVVKMSRFGKFYACSGFPQCKYKEKYEGE